MESENTAVIDGVEYSLEDFTDEQKIWLHHVQDFDAKLAKARFNFDQLTVAREAFAEKLAASLEKKIRGG